MKMITKQFGKQVVKSKQGWRAIGGKRSYYRSAWEANYARFLSFMLERGLIKGWEHEPKTYWFEGIKRGVCSYLPDFSVIKLDGSQYVVEVKGFMDSRSATKIKRFKKYYPEIPLLVITKQWFAKNLILKKLIKSWE